jgi:RNA polymerase primary sigma factor
MKMATDTLTARNPAARAAVAVKPSKRNERTEFIEGGDPLASYFREIKAIKGLSLAEEQVLSQRIRAGDNQAVKLLVEGNLKFVVAVCRNYRSQGLSMSDLISEGNLGLMRAARRYDGSMNFKFISYAVWWIRQGILTALAEQTRVLNLSAGKVELIRKIGKANRMLTQKLGRQPFSLEVAEEVGISETEMDASLYLAKPAHSLSGMGTGEEDSGTESNLPDPDAPGTDASARAWVLSKAMQGMLGVLTEQENEILRLFFGIGREDNLTLTEIATRFDVTRERIRQIKATALQKLRHPVRARRLAALRE